MFADKERLKIVKEISKALKLPVVTSNFSNQYDVFNPFIKCYEAGPMEFLTLIRDAKLVVASSFHGTVFSILLNVPFFAINGLKDARIKTLLESLNLEDREITIENLNDKCTFAEKIDFDETNIKVEQLKQGSIEFLKQSLSV